jgi:hypothetical protein
MNIISLVVLLFLLGSVLKRVRKNWMRKTSSPTADRNVPKICVKSNPSQHVATKSVTIFIPIKILPQKVWQLSLDLQFCHTCEEPSQCLSKK